MAVTWQMVTVWHASLQGMALDDSELREFTNGMLGNIAELLEEEFAPYLPNAVQAAIASCSQVCSVMVTGMLLALAIGLPGPVFGRFSPVYGNTCSGESILCMCKG
jgi:hypothetical protein